MKNTLRLYPAISNILSQKVFNKEINFSNTFDRFRIIITGQWLPFRHLACLWVNARSARLQRNDEEIVSIRSAKAFPATMASCIFHIFYKFWWVCTRFKKTNLDIFWPKISRDPRFLVKRLKLLDRNNLIIAVDIIITIVIMIIGEGFIVFHYAKEKASFKKMNLSYLYTRNLPCKVEI